MSSVSAILHHLNAHSQCLTIDNDICIHPFLLAPLTWDVCEMTSLRTLQKALAGSLADMADTVAALAPTSSKEVLVSTVVSLIETSGNVLEVLFR